MKILKTALFSGVFALGAVGAGAAFAQQPYENLEEWEVTVAFDTEGAFEVCTATKEMRNGEGVILYTHPDFLAIGLLLERWILDDRETYDVALQFNDGRRWPGEAIAGEDKKSVVVSWNFADSMDEIRAGGSLYLHTAAGSLRYNIDGAGDALDSAIRCILDNTPEPAE